MSAAIGLALAAWAAWGCGSPGPGTAGTTGLAGLAGTAGWWVDPAQLPLPATATRIDGFLHEQACASGTSPEGRIVGPEIVYHPDAVTVTFGVRPIGGTCPSNPWFPITVELAEQLGGRALIDGGSGRDATIDPTIVLAPDEDCGPLREAETDAAKIACIALISATLGDRYQEFARVSVAPDDTPCRDDECATAEGVEARAWRVDATDRDGGSYRWRCTYRVEAATCVEAAGPSPS